MRITSFIGVSLIIVSVAVGATAGSAPTTGKTAGEKKTSKWVFSLLPRAFQSNPRVDLAVITEMTDEGKKLPVPTAEKPVYYFAQAAGFHGEGHGVQKAPSLEPEKIEAQMSEALRGNHYLPASPEHPPTLVLFYHWGEHNRLDPEFDDLGNRNLLSRAQLVGGTKFADELRQALNEQELTGTSSRDISDPVHRLIERDDLTRQLMEQIFSDCYFIVVSAYEGAALAQGQRKLLWRTKITTSAQGLALKETMPVLVAGGSGHYGREMPTAAVVDKRLRRGGRVDIGEAEVKEYIEPATEKKDLENR